MARVVRQLVIASILIALAVGNIDKGAGILPPASASEVSGSEFEVPPGFEVTTAADDALVHDAFCMTLDASARPVVSGPGYIRTLIDDDRDGVFERYVQWTSLPKEGAQGLWSEEGVLYWVGDGGLWKSVDRNGDLTADAAPTKVLTLPTGGEHDAHAIRRGPDGWWYLIVGNFANDILKLANTPESFVKKPRAGTIWRISPDFSQRFVWASGFRNAYDFDFLANGRIITYDSDEEREVSLPWYRPTRVMVVSPGNDAGWVDSAWFDVDDRLTMPQVVSKLGRGSPTGVAVYHHRGFPQKYSQAAFVLDWTFGRVIAIYPQPGDENARPSRFMAETFMQASGVNGFAPTDLCVAADGSLLVCVGGRGTSGAIYRIRYTSTADVASPSPLRVSGLASIADPDEKLRAALDIPCPWESWSSLEWRKALDKLPPTVLADVLAGKKLDHEADLQLNEQRRRRAAQYATYRNVVIDSASLQKAVEAEGATTQAAAYWYAGRSLQAKVPPISNSKETADRNVGQPDKSLSDWDALLGGLVERQRWEATALKKWPVVEPEEASGETTADWRSRYAVRQAYLWALSRQRATPLQPVALNSKPNSFGYDQRLAGVLFGSGSSRIEAELMDELARRISGKQIGTETDRILEAVTALQICLGDFRHSVPPQQAPPQVHALDGYRAVYAKNVADQVREGWAKWCLSLARYNGDDAILIQNESLRALAMLESKSPSAVEECLNGITDESHPTADLHRLAVLACCKAPRTAEQTASTAKALFGVVHKVEALELNTDSRWNTRLEQIFRELIAKDRQLPRAMVSTDGKLDASHLFWIEWCPSEIKSEAAKAIMNQLLAVDCRDWSPPLLRFASGSQPDARLVRRLREGEFAADPVLKVELLAAKPEAGDYRFMFDQLSSPHRMTWPHAWKVVSKLPIQDPKLELNTLAVLWTKLTQAPLAEISASTLVGRLRSIAVRLQLASVPAKDSLDQWLPFFKSHLEAETYAKLESLRGASSSWRKIVSDTVNMVGNATKGEELYRRMKCAQCHGGGNALGPNLSGVTRRFSRDDLFQAVYDPNRDIPDRYRALKVLTDDGEVFVGMKVYDSIDGVTLQTADGKVVRINRSDIESKSTSDVSLMPSGLLDAASPQEIADLYAYLRNL